ncbi:MAG: MFS transporter [Sphingomonadales bacterium]|nr:MAG: MFS transporter [Sphingomonadales bacterium]
MSTRPFSPSAADPVRPTLRSTRFLLIFALAYAGGVIGYLPLLTLLLPARIEGFAGDTRLDLFTATVIAGAIAASLSNLLFGWLSDRSLARGGGRRRWMAFGVAATAFAYAAIALAATPLAIVLAVVAFQAAVNAILAPLLALMADEIPDVQKGLAGGMLAFANPLASAVTTLLVSASVLSDDARLMIVPLAVALCVAPMLLTAPHRLGAQPVSPAQAALSRRDLAVAWAARLLIQISGAVLSLYLLYYFESVSPLPASALSPRLGQLLTFAFVLTLPLAVIAGRLSDRIGRRKPFLFVTALLTAGALLVMSAAGSFAVAAAGFVLFSVGSGIFLALHSAFSMQLLPDPRHRGRDMGLINLTNTLPPLLGAPLTWLLATPQDFGSVMLVLAGLALCSSLTILAIRERA